MSMKNPFLIFLFIASLVSKTSAQVEVLNNGAQIMVEQGAVVYIDGHFRHQLNGNITNHGNIHMTGDWDNKSQNDVFVHNPNGWVHMIGVNQHIKGTALTHFNSLELAGTGVKYLDSLDAEVEDTLDLTDREFNVDTNTVHVLYEDVSAVQRMNVFTGGFVSSLMDGGISRKTNSTGVYLFPVGSKLGTVRYRPVTLTPNATNANTFHVRLANNNATVDAYDINVADTTLCFVNDKFYHRIMQLVGTDAADVEIDYEHGTSKDGLFNTIAHWQNKPQWEDTKNNTFTTGTPLSKLEKASWGNYSPKAFALAYAYPIDTVYGTSGCEGDTILLSGSGNYSNYDFYYNGNLVQSGNSPVYQIVSDSVGLMTVNVYDTAACPSTIIPIPGSIFPNPDITILEAPDTTIILGESVTLQALSTHTSTNFLWKPTFETTPDITVSPENDTTYMVIGTDVNGCQDTAYVIVKIDKDCVHWLPNIFSPNGDGRNDEFTLRHKGLETYFIAIYDRWGNLVFESDDKFKNWDGKHNGTITNNNVYVYMMNGKCFNSEEPFEQPGNVTVVR